MPLHVPSTVQALVTHLPTAGPIPDHSPWVQKEPLGPHVHRRGPASHQPQRPPALFPNTQAGPRVRAAGVLQSLGSPCRRTLVLNVCASGTVAWGERGLVWPLRGLLPREGLV